MKTIYRKLKDYIQRTESETTTSKGLGALPYFEVLFAIWKERIPVDEETKEIEEEHEFKPRYELIEKELKALDIIKKNGVNVLNFMAHFIISIPEYDEYQYYVDNFEKYDFGAFLLPKQDFELLKEVLL